MKVTEATVVSDPRLRTCLNKLERAMPPPSHGEVDALARGHRLTVLHTLDELDRLGRGGVVWPHVALPPCQPGSAGAGMGGRTRAGAG